jgi:hypothetical protein
MTIAIKITAQSQNMNPDIAINVQKNSPKESNIFALLGNKIFSHFNHCTRLLESLVGNVNLRPALDWFLHETHQRKHGVDVNQLWLGLHIVFTFSFSIPPMVSAQ